MPIAVFSALRVEMELLLESLDGATTSKIADWPVWTGTIGPSPVILARTGMGKVNTAALAGIIWERHRPELIVFTGVAGGLDPRLGVGDVVVGDRSIQHDAGVLGPRGLERYQSGHIPFFNPTDDLGYAPSGGLLDLMREVVRNTRLTPVLGRDPEVVFGTILTGDQFLRDAASRDRLFKELGAQAIEMEGAALAQTAGRLGADHLVIRSLSDLAGDEAIEDFDRFLPEVSANSVRLVLEMIERLEENDGDLPVGP